MRSLGDQLAFGQNLSIFKTFLSHSSNIPVYLLLLITEVMLHTTVVKLLLPLKYVCYLLQLVHLSYLDLKVFLFSMQVEQSILHLMALIVESITESLTMRE